MMSKFARVAYALRPSQAVWQPRRAASALQSAGALHRVGGLHRVGASPTTVMWPQCMRARSYMVPASQYDTPLPAMFKFVHVITTYWEVIPLFVCTAVSISIVILYAIWASMNKVDIVFTPYNRNNISRTMDLCNPTPHKMMIVNQRYDPWPDMQCVLDKMATAEKRLKVRTKECSFAK